MVVAQRWTNKEERYRNTPLCKRNICQNDTFVGKEQNTLHIAGSTSYLYGKNEIESLLLTDSKTHFRQMKCVIILC